MADALRKIQCPAHNLHTPEAAADHCSPNIYTQHISQARLTGDPIAHANHWEIGAPGFAGCRVDGTRPSRTVATAEVIECNYKKFVGINRFAGADIGIPPAGTFVVHAVITGGVMMARKRVANQYRIGFFSV